MRVRKVACNSSFSMTFDEFEGRFLDCHACVFTDDYQHFATTCMGVVEDEFDVFWDSEDERLRFIDWIKGFDL